MIRHKKQMNYYNVKVYLGRRPCRITHVAIFSQLSGGDGRFFHIVGLLGRQNEPRTKFRFQSSHVGLKTTREYLRGWVRTNENLNWKYNSPAFFPESF